MRQVNESVVPLKEVDGFGANLLVDGKNRKVEVVAVIWAAQNRNPASIILCVIMSAPMDIKKLFSHIPVDNSH